MEEELKQGNFTGWCIVEMMGHRREIGYVTTEAFGPAVLFRVDTPELPEREYVLTAPEYTSNGNGERLWTPVGSKVKRPAIPARTCLVGPASLYAMNPCTEEAARMAIEKSVTRPLILIEIAAGKALPEPEEYIDAEDDDDEDDDDPYA